MQKRNRCARRLRGASLVFAVSRVSNNARFDRTPAKIGALSAASLSAISEGAECQHPLLVRGLLSSSPGNGAFHQRRVLNFVERKQA